jgi:site-specific DNA-methyltransferase (adenine-specific)
MITITNEDNMQLMARYPDKYFDLAIVDPPYGIGAANMKMGTGKKLWKPKDWDSTPPIKEYFDELFRVSKNQIIWGGNYFTNHLPISRCWISWSKFTPEGMSFSDLELAWTSFDAVAREVRIRHMGAAGQKDYEQRIHPTMKPTKLYKWLLDNYAKPVSCECDSAEYVALDNPNQCSACGNTGKRKPRILDTHLGSGSIAIACHDYGFDLTACELDKDYYEAAMKRLNNHMAQIKMEL